MKTKKTYTILSILTCLFVFNILFSCQNGSELHEPTSKAEFTTLYITIDDSERTVMPESISLSNLSFKLSGNKTGETQETIQTWNNSTDIPLSAITLKSGTWDFTMNAYSAGKLVLTSTKEKVFLQGESKTVNFNLDEPNELLGSIDETFEFPVGSENIPGAKKIVAKLIQDSDEEIEVDSQILIPEDIETDSTKQFVRYQKLNIKEGYYFLRFYIYQLENADYTNFHSTYIRVEPGLESKGNESISSLDSKKYKLTLDLNGGVWNENVVIPKDFTKLIETALPIGTASFESEYWTNATLDGWYEIPEDGNLTEVPIITTLPTGIEEDKTLYAKWTITCEEKDIQGAFDNFSDGRFDIKLSTFHCKPLENGAVLMMNVKNFCLNDKNKYVVLDFIDVDKPTYLMVGQSTRNSCWSVRYEGSESIISVILPPYLNDYRLLLYSRIFYQCSNLKRIVYSMTIEEAKNLRIYIDGNIYIGLTYLFDRGAVISCQDGDYVVPKF